MVKKFILIAFSCFQGQRDAVSGVTKAPDSLQNKGYNYLFDKAELYKNDNFKRTVYLKAFLKNAKAEKNWEETVNGYQNYVHYAPYNLKLIYADSMVTAAETSKNNMLLGTAYLSKGVVYYGQKKHTLALDNYLIADGYISRTNDLYLKYKVKYTIGQIKYYLGYYHEAISLFRECVGYFKGEEDGAYLDTLHMLALCYNKIGNYGLSSEMNATGISESERLDNNRMKSYFTHMEGINQYYKENYAAAINKINLSLPVIKVKQDFANEAVGYFYIGKCYWALRQKEKAILFLSKADKILTRHGYMHPSLRENYELIIDYYKAKGNNKAIIRYVEKLLALDRNLEATYKHLAGRVHKEYDTKELVQEKEKAQKRLLDREQHVLVLIIVVVTLFFSILFLGYRYLANRKKYRLKFEEIMNEKKVNDPAPVAQNDDRAVLDINTDTITTVLKLLEKFEREKKFLEKGLTAVKLAAAFNSNIKYLSKIIHYYKGKGFVEYLNGLRIDYIVALLKVDKKIQNYTDKALAEEAGFSSTQRFANAFIAKTEISPRYFVKGLKKLAALEGGHQED